jgi:ABC-2 type transport system ATP-binding protein
MSHMQTTSISPYVVETEGLTKRFGERTVVRDVELRVPRGTAFGSLGPNGAGKTTLIRMLLGLTPASAGSMRLLGVPVPERCAAALARVGAIARCLLADPELLILDEPMNGLDPAGILEFRAFVRSFVGEGRTIVLSSHLLDEVEKTCDHVAIVDGGTVVTQGSIDELRGGQAPQLVVGADDNARARVLLAAHPAVASVTDDGNVLRLALRDGDAVADLNRRLVESGLAVHRLEPADATLEQRFLELTTRLENAA